jgi:Methyltransferase domain
MHASTDTCRVCGNPSGFVFALRLLDAPVGYYECKVCGYLQTESPHWLETAYQHPINDVDTGIMARNLVNAGRVTLTLLAYGLLDGRVIDHAGGFGILVRLLRDAGVDARWRDKYCENMLARGFEADTETFDLLTAFEVLEHLVDPVLELEKMLAVAPIVLVSTELVPTPNTPSPDWWYLGPEHGQHIGFFRSSTLKFIAARLGCSFASDGHSIHVFSRRQVPLLWRPLMGARLVYRLVKRFKLRSKIQADFDFLRAQRTAHANPDTNGNGDPIIELTQPSIKKLND